MSYYAITPLAFDGGTDATDDLVQWVQAPNIASARAAFPDCRVEELDFVPTDDCVDRVIQAVSASPGQR